MSVIHQVFRYKKPRLGSSGVITLADYCTLFLFKAGEIVKYHRYTTF